MTEGLKMLCLMLAVNVGGMVSWGLDTDNLSK
jgi:hypothetical protein